MYVFNTRNHEPWSLDDNDQDGKSFWKDSHQFLTSHGYILVDTPEAGDVIAYGIYDANKRKGYYQHFGIYEGEGQVISKFDMGHIFQHPWDLIPSSYGKQIAFYRKLPI